MNKISYHINFISLARILWMSFLILFHFQKELFSFSQQGKYKDNTMYEGWSKSSFLFMIQRKVWILSKFCDFHIEIKYISSNWMLFYKQLWRHSLWHVTSRDIPNGVIVVNRFSRVASAKFEIFFRSKQHSIPLRNAHLKLLATDANTI